MAHGLALTCPYPHSRTKVSADGNIIIPPTRTMRQAFPPQAQILKKSWQISAGGRPPAVLDWRTDSAGAKAVLYRW
jgi:hypothetical protein